MARNGTNVVNFKINFLFILALGAKVNRILILKRLNLTYVNTLSSKYDKTTCAYSTMSCAGTVSLLPVFLPNLVPKNDA